MDFEHMAHAYSSKTHGELEQLARAGVQTAGNAFSSVLLVKGEPGAAELQGGDVFSGADGMALRAALGALGYAPEDWCGIACWDGRGITIAPALFRTAIATLDPATIVATDAVAANLIGVAYDLDTLPLGVGGVGMVRGMRVLCLDGFEAALGQMRTKQVMWARLKQIPPLGEPY